MQREGREFAYVWDMRESARAIVEMTESVTFELFTSDRMRRRAVEREFTVLGEAANRVSPEFKSAHLK